MNLIAVNMIDLSQVNITDSVVQPFNLLGYKRDHAEEVAAVTEDDVKKMVVGGKRINELLKQYRERAQLKSPITPYYNNESASNFVKIADLKVRVFGEPTSADLTKKKE